MLTIPTLRLSPGSVTRSLMACRTRGAPILGAPHQVLLTPPPLIPSSSDPPQHPVQHPVQHQRSTSYITYTFRSSTDREATLKQSVSALSLRLRQHHRFRVGWPIEHTEYTGHRAERLHAYLTNAIVMPCLDLLSQLRAYFIKEPLHQISRRPEDGMFTHVAGGSGIHCIHPGVSIITITNVLPFPSSTPILIFVVSAMLLFHRISFM